MRIEGHQCPDTQDDVLDSILDSILDGIPDIMIAIATGHKRANGDEYVHLMICKTPQNSRTPLNTVVEQHLYYSMSVVHSPRAHIEQTGRPVISNDKNSDSKQSSSLNKRLLF